MHLEKAIQILKQKERHREKERKQRKRDIDLKKMRGKDIEHDKGNETV